MSPLPSRVSVVVLNTAGHTCTRAWAWTAAISNAGSPAEALPDAGQCAAKTGADPVEPGPTAPGLPGIAATFDVGRTAGAAFTGCADGRAPPVRPPTLQAASNTAGA